MARAAVEDPIKVHRFRVVIDGFVRAGFSEVSGFEKNTEDAPYREGAFNDTPQTSAGLTKYGDITIKRGQIVNSQRGGDNDMDEWSDSVSRVASGGNAENYRRDLDIEQYSASNIRVRVWRLFEAWPNKFVPMSGLNALETANSYEELVLKNEGWKRVL